MTAKHIHALKELDSHPALQVLSDEQVERITGHIRDADMIEMERAQRYLDALDPGEVERRASMIYTPDYTSVDGGEVDFCDVCGNCSLVAAGRDGVMGAVAYGHCMVCSYERTPEVAEESAMDEHLRRQLDRPD